MTIYAALTDNAPQAVVEEFSGQGFGTFKPRLADLLVETLRPIAGRLRELSGDPAAVDAILADGSSRAAQVAAPTLAGAYRALGLASGR